MDAPCDHSNTAAITITTTTNNSNNDDDNNNDGGKRKIECKVTAPSSMATVDKIIKRARRRLHPCTQITLYDNTSPGYGWLLPGWLGEERVMESGRVYRYYYDPDGRLYNTQQEVFIAWEKNGLVVLDK